MKKIIGKSNFKIKKRPRRIVIDKKVKDFSKVFDTVDYKILIRNLEKYEIKCQYINWFKSYLNFCKQYVRTQKQPHSLKKIICGVPQSSIFGLLFSPSII